MECLCLDNGLTLVIGYYPGHSSGIDLCFNYGSAFEKSSEAGIAHFLEHIFFSGSKKLGRKKSLELVESAGGELNAFTSREETHYYSRIHNKEFIRPLMVFSECFNDGYFRDADVELEKKIVLNEIRETRDNPVKRLFDEFMEVSMGKTFGRRTIGSEKTVQSINRSKLEKCLKKNYYSKNLTIGIASSLSEEKLAREIGNRFVARAGKPVKLKGKPPKPKHREKLIRAKTEQAHCCLGFPVMDARHKDWLAAQLINEYLGGGLSARLPREIREKRGLSYAVSSFLDSEKNHGVFAVYFSTAESKIKKAKGLVLKELSALQEKKLSSRTLKQTKSRFLGHLTLETENSFNSAKRLVEAYVYNQPNIEQLPSALKSISPNDVKRVAQEFLQTEQYAFTALLPNNPNHTGHKS